MAAFAPSPYASSASSSDAGDDAEVAEAMTTVVPARRPETEAVEVARPWWQSFRGWWSRHSLSRVQILVLSCVGVVLGHVTIAWASEEGKEVKPLFDPSAVLPMENAAITRTNGCSLFSPIAATVRPTTTSNLALIGHSLIVSLSLLSGYPFLYFSRAIL